MSSVTISNGNITYSEASPPSSNTAVAGRPSAHNISGAGLLATAHSPNGRALSGSDITEASLVKLGNDRMTVREAMHCGLITRNGDGSLREVHRSTPPAAAVQQLRNNPQSAAQFDEVFGRGAAAQALQGQQRGEPAAEALDREHEAVVDRFAKEVEPRTALAAIGELSTGSEISRATIERAASQMGMEPDEVAQMAGQVRQAFEGQARAVAERSGFDADELFGWAWEHNPDAMRDAIRQHATERTTKGYEKVVQSYLYQLAEVNPQAILSAQFPPGVEAKQLRNGRIVLVANGDQMEWRAAVRAGRVKVSRAR